MEGLKFIFGYPPPPPMYQLCILEIIKEEKKHLTSPTLPSTE